jgi:transposase-like protein
MNNKADVNKGDGQGMAKGLEVPPNPEVVPRATRRTFTAEYKLRILKEAEACTAQERGALLRREGLYASHLTHWREHLIKGVEELSGLVGTAEACRVLGVPRATVYRKRDPRQQTGDAVRSKPARALSDGEREEVLKVLRSERFVDQPLPASTPRCSTRTGSTSAPLGPCTAS